MATLTATVNGVITNLSNDSPFAFESLVDASSAEVVRHRQRGPLQSGVTDLGYRLRPRELTLTLRFKAATLTLLDTYRDTLTEAFKPLSDLPITLAYERDDGTTRQLTCYAIDEIAIDLLPEHWPGKLHRATIKLRASNPAWVGTSATTATFTGSGTSTWQRGGTAIGTANIMEYVEYPTQGQAWTYVGTITSAWSIAFRSGSVTPTVTPTAYHAGTTGINNSSTDARFYYAGGAWKFSDTSPTASAMRPGTVNYIAVNDIDGFSAEGWNQQRIFVDGNTTYLTNDNIYDYNIMGTVRRWRSDRTNDSNMYWPEEMPKAAVYNITLSSTQRTALDAWMAGTVNLGTINAVNAGDLYEYPRILIYGPLQDPLLTNAATGDVLDLTGLTVAASEVCIVDLRDGNKYVADINGETRMSSLDNPISLAGWNLAPAPVASGGTNAITLQGGGTVTNNTRVVIEYYNHYLSF